MTPRFSIYTSAFNVIRNNFDWRGALINFLDFADEVVVAVNSSEDDTLYHICQYATEVNGNSDPKLIVLPTDFSYSDPGLDGKVKNAALQATTEEFKIQLDLDERIPLWQKPLWERSARELSDRPEAGAMFISVVNLYGDEEHAKDISHKWYLHKEGLYRGVVNFAKNPDGTHDIKKSDGCELIDSKGSLVFTLGGFLVAAHSELQAPVLQTQCYPFVVHYGYENLERRIQLNKQFWKNHWAVEAGHEVSIATEIQNLPTEKPFKHGLRLS